MSTKTRQRKRKAAAEHPVYTDWLWSCPREMLLDEVAHQLGFTHEPRTELSVQAWTDEQRLKQDLHRAFVPDISADELVPHMAWDAFDEYLRDACIGGRLIVLRELPTELPSALHTLIDIIGFRRSEHGFHTFESRPGARFALVLSGWAKPTIRVRFRRVVRYTVQLLGSASEPSLPK